MISQELRKPHIERNQMWARLTTDHQQTRKWMPLFNFSATIIGSLSKSVFQPQPEVDVFAFLDSLYKGKQTKP